MATHTAERIQATIEQSLNGLTADKLDLIDHIGIGEITMKALSDAGVTEGPMAVGDTEDILLDVHGDTELFTLKYDPEENDGYVPRKADGSVVF